MPSNARSCAVKAISDVLYGRSLSKSLPETMSRCAQQEKARLQQLVYGTLRDFPRLIGILDQLLKKKPDQNIRNNYGQVLWEFFHENIKSKNNIFHADVHPGNFLFCEGGKVV